jgi:hypothetical protein
MKIDGGFEPAAGGDGTVLGIFGARPDLASWMSLCGPFAIRSTGRRASLYKVWRLERAGIIRHRAEAGGTILN